MSIEDKINALFCRYINTAERAVNTLRCYVHPSRNISMMDRPVKREEVLDDFKKFYRAADAVTS